MITLIIDSREYKFIEKIEKYPIKNCCIEKKQLDIGDMYIQNNNNINYIIERKTINDLISSIKDGRYREQKLRVLSSLKTDTQFQNTQYLYLIEGDINNFKVDIKKTYYGTYISLLLRDNIKIIKTNSLEDTVEFFTRLVNRLNIRNDLIISNPYTNNQIGGEQPNNYLETIKSKKKENVTAEKAQILFLNIIPGISINIATKIIDQFSTIKHLIEEYNKIPQITDKERMLEKIQITEKRKLGKVLSARIFNFICVE